jgi:peptidyl-prolyl cis-trans isomerase C
VGEFSEVIESPAGYHILQLIELDTQRTLEPGALQTLQVKALENWLQERRSESQIEILVPLAASGSNHYGSI